MTNYIEHRPWGNFEILTDNENIKIKIITVNPGQRLSYQYHHKRAEDWYIISGVASITIDGNTQLYKAGQHVHIPVEARHRVSNDVTYNGEQSVVFLEVQTGTYFGEDDIVRISDDYGR